MKQIFRNITPLIAAVCLLLTLVLSGCSKEHMEKSESAVFTVAIKEISERGNVLLDTTFEDMKAHEMEVGDIITVSIGDVNYDMPVGTSYTDVDTGSMLCRFDLEDNEIALVINMGAFAVEAKVGEKQEMKEEPGYKWDVRTNEIGLILKEKKGYLDEYKARNLERSNARKDYPELTDEEFANFRAVTATGIKENWLYRSSTPIEPAIGRNEIAMTATEAAGIRSIINLDDSIEQMMSYETYPDSYYSRCTVINPEMSYDFMSEEFSEKVKESILFIIENDGPYLIHCKEGKDRTGILCAILECFAGASAEEVERDYMLTYHNYYGVEPDDPTYDIIVKNLVRPLSGLLGTNGIETADLKEKAEAYLVSIGLTEHQLEMLEAKLNNAADPTAAIQGVFVIKNGNEIQNGPNQKGINPMLATLVFYEDGTFYFNFDSGLSTGGFYGNYEIKDDHQVIAESTDSAYPENVHLIFTIEDEDTLVFVEDQGGNQHYYVNKSRQLQAVAEGDSFVRSGETIEEAQKRI